jgi:hypothetical protein
LDLMFGALEPEEVGELKAEIEKTTGAAAKAILVKWATKAAGTASAPKFKEFAA